MIGSVKPKSFTVGVVSTMWGKHELARLVMQHWREMFHAMGGRLAPIFMMVGSEGDVSREVAVCSGWNYLEFPNKPVWKKWNYGLFQVYQTYDPDFYMAPGSDDLVDRQYLEYVYEQACRGSNYIGPVDCYFWDTEFNRVKYFPGFSGKRSGETIGPFRVVGRPLMQKMGGAYYTSMSREDSNFVDGCLTHRVNEAESVMRVVRSKCSVKDIQSFPTQIKCGKNVNGFNDYAGENMDSDILQQVYPVMSDDMRCLLTEKSRT